MTEHLVCDECGGLIEVKPTRKYALLCRFCREWHEKHRAIGPKAPPPPRPDPAVTISYIGG